MLWYFEQYEWSGKYYLKWQMYVNIAKGLCKNIEVDPTNTTLPPPS